MSKTDDSRFFLEVLKDPEFRDVRKRCGVKEWNPAVGEQPHNSVLKLWKSNWLLPLSHMDVIEVKGVNVHFEARVRNELRVEAEIDPYIPSLDKQPEIEHALKLQLDLKADLLKRVRERLLREEALRALGVTAKSQPETGKTSTQCAVKFTSDKLPKLPEPSDVAAYFARIVVSASPLIDEIIEATCLRLSEG
jgi:hypothetical protein